VIALTSPYFWYTTRATGLMSLVLFTAVVCLGSLVANRIGGTIVGRFELNEFHRSLSMVAVVFLVIHVLTTVLDSYVSTGWLAAVVPFASHYRTLPVAVGAVAFDLLAAVWISSLLKLRIANPTWRAIHWFSWAAFAAAVVHGFTTGSDTHHPLGLAVVGLCALSALAAGIGRFFGRPTRAGGRTALSPLAPSKATAQPPRATPRTAPSASRPTTRPSAPKRGRR
jgi:predicted ferric reductase